MISKRLAAFGLALAFSAPLAAAQTADRAPAWLNKPTFLNLLSVYPAEAMKQGLGGKAVISCTVNTRGALYGCSIVSETPGDLGFGAAALALAPQFLMTPEIRNGVAVESTVRIPITFEMPFPGHPMTLAFDGARDVISNPPWIDAPSLADVAAAYPKKARAARVGGQVTLVCIVTDAGALDHCRTVREEPEGFGFSRAALRLTVRFKAPEKLGNGQPVADAAVQVPVAFAPEMLDGVTPPSRPHWAQKPKPAELVALLPPAGLKGGIRKARAELICQVAPGGGLDACKVDQEDPKGQGVGAAALSAAPKYRISPWSEDGAPMVGVKIRLPIEFALETP